MSSIKKFLITISIGLCALLTEFGFHRPEMAFWIIAIMGGIMAFSMLVDMIQTLRQGKYGVDILAITAIVATLLVGEYWASLVVLIMLTGGDSLEEYASRQASAELHSLLKNSPQIAHRTIADEITDIKVEEVKINDSLLVKPGELVPVDGRVVKGTTYVDESSLTGEARLVEKKQDDSLMSGSLVKDTSIYMQVDKKASD